MRRSILVVGAAVVALAAAVAGPACAGSSERIAKVLADRSGEAWFDPKDKENCERQAGLPWCVAPGVVQARAAGQGASEDAQLVAWAEKVARASWRTPDPKNNPEHWESFADRALAGKAWVGDCDNLTFTVLDLLARQGFPVERMYRVQRPTKNPSIYHMVGMVQLSDGRYFIVGDAANADDAAYEVPADWPVSSFNHVTEGTTWFDVSPANLKVASLGGGR